MSSVCTNTYIKTMIVIANECIKLRWLFLFALETRLQMADDREFSLT